MTSQDPELPVWIQSRLKAVQKKPKCDVTHGACRCFIEKIIRLEAEVAKLKEENMRPVHSPDCECSCSGTDDIQ